VENLTQRREGAKMIRLCHYYFAVNAMAKGKPRLADACLYRFAPLREIPSINGGIWMHATGAYSL
jgi:hypothetical protein